MSEKPTKEQMAEQIRQKITETMFWLRQAADTVYTNEQSKNEIETVICELENMDLEVARAFEEAGKQMHS
jgi:hypothetical protein